MFKTIIQKKKNYQISEKRYWVLIAILLNLYLSFDLLTSFYAINQVGLNNESNSFMKFIFNQDFFFIVSFHLFILLLSVFVFYIIYQTFKEVKSYKKYLYYKSIETILITIILFGVLICLNNFMVAHYKYNLIYNILHFI